MTRDEIEATTNRVFEESFEVESATLRPGANLFADLGLDSLDTVDLVVALQKAFGVRIRDDARVRGIRTLGDVYDYIEALKTEGVTPNRD